MRPKVILDAISGNLYPETFDIEAHKTSTELQPVLEVVGGEGARLSSLSAHCSYLATVTREEDGTSGLFILNLQDNSYYLLKRLRETCTVLSFHPYHESTLFVATASHKVYGINVDDGSVVVMEGHRAVAEGVQCGVRSTVVVTYNVHEALVWSWPSLALTSRLRLLENVPLIWAGHIWQRDELVAAFTTGSIVIWASHNRSIQHTIQPPEGIQFAFEAFALSRCGDWLVGGGRSRLVVRYSLPGRCLSVVQLPTYCPALISPIFLPAIDPRYSQVLSVQGSSGLLIIIDFSTCSKLKTLRSQRFSIESVSVSEDGNYTAITYTSGTTKLYPSRALLPPNPKEVDVEEVKREEVAFQIIERRQREEDQEEEKRKKRKKLTEELEELLDKNKWYRILREFGSYPDKYRKIIWVSVLQLPRNYSVLGALLDKGTHPAYQGLEEEFKLTDGTLFRALQRTLSCLGHWAPFLTTVTFLPELVFPFVKLFHSNVLLCFEICATVILNWCRVWFEFWPQSSVMVVNVVEDIVGEEDPTLLAHFIRLRVTANVYAWTPLTAAFSTVFSDDAWLTLWDHILSNPPSFLACVAAAFTLRSRHTLLSCSEAAEIKMYYRQETWVQVKQILNKAYDLHQGGRGGESGSGERRQPLSKIFGEFVPLPHGGLPLFTLAPRDPVQEEIEEFESQLNEGNPSSECGARTSANQQPQQQQQQQQEQEEMVYVVGRSELQQQERECLNSIINLRKCHLASTIQHTSN